MDEELSIPPESRTNCHTFMKYLRQDINQVSVKGNAAIPQNIRDACYAKFNSIQDFNIPDICGQIEHTKSYEEFHPITVSVKDPSINKKDKIPNPQIYSETSGILDALVINA